MYIYIIGVGTGAGGPCSPPPPNILGGGAGPPNNYPWMRYCSTVKSRGVGLHVLYVPCSCVPFSCRSHPSLGHSSSLTTIDQGNTHKYGTRSSLCVWLQQVWMIGWTWSMDQFLTVYIIYILYVHYWYACEAKCTMSKCNILKSACSHLLTFAP